MWIKIVGILLGLYLVACGLVGWMLAAADGEKFTFPGYWAMIMGLPVMIKDMIFKGHTGL